MSDYDLFLNIVNAMVIVCIIFELVKCFFGYKLERVFSAFAGFGAGAIIGVVLTALFYRTGQYFFTVLILASLALGILGAYASFRFYRVGAFIYMFTTAFAFMYGILDALVYKNADLLWSSPDSLVTTILNTSWQSINWVLPLAAVAAGIIVGLLTIKEVRKTVIFATGISGGAASSISIFRDIIGYENIAVTLLVAAALAVLGIAVQYITTRGGKKRR